MAYERDQRHSPVEALKYFEKAPERIYAQFRPRAG
jgi:hypothetical protein